MTGEVLIEVEISDRWDGRDRGALFDAVAAGLRRAGPFAVVVRLPATAPARRRRPEGNRMRWLRAHRREIAARCAGIAYVYGSARTRAAAPDPETARRVWGPVVEGFDDVAPARAWARGRLAASSGILGGGGA